MTEKLQDEKVTHNGLLLLFLSDYKTDAGSKYQEAEERNYSYKSASGEKTYTGRQTNEAPVKFLIQKAKEEGFPIKTVLCIASSAVRNNQTCGKDVPIINKDGKTAFEIFKTRIMHIIGDDARIISVEYEENFQYKNAINIYADIMKYIKKINDGKIYIDYTGGLRDTSFLMITIIQYLEHIGIKCGAVVYSDYNKQEIRDITYIYDMMRMINAVNEFASNGNSKGLIGFKEYTGITGLDKLLERVKAFSDSITLCDVSTVGEDLANIKTELGHIKVDVNTDEPGKTLYFQMFETIIPLMEDKLYIDKITDSPEETYKNIPWIIKWCIDNEKIQQAATLFVEKMPEYYCKAYFGGTNGKRLNPKDFYGAYDSFCNRTSTQKNDIRVWADRFKEYDKTQILKKLKKLSSNNMELTEGVKYREIVSRIRNIYDEFGKRKAEAQIYGLKMVPIPKDIKKFMNELSVGKPLFIHYLKYNDPSTFIQKEKDKPIQTYQNKYDAIKYIEQGNDKVDRKVVPEKLDYRKLSGMMRSYLVVKILRNNLNHANTITGHDDSNVDVSEENVKQALVKDGFNMKDSLESFKEDILKALSDELYVFSERTGICK